MLILPSSVHQEPHKVQLKCCHCYHLITHNNLITAENNKFSFLQWGNLGTLKLDAQQVDLDAGCHVHRNNVLAQALGTEEFLLGNAQIDS